MSTRLFVGGIPYEAKDEDLHELFAHAGGVVNAHVKTHRASGRSRGFGFVEMADNASAQRALDTLNGAELMGRKLRVQWAEQRDVDQQSRSHNRYTPQPRSRNQDPPQSPTSHRKIVIFGGILLMLLTTLGIWLGLNTERKETTLLVSPFDVRGQAEGAEYLGLSIAEAVAVNLAPLEKLNVPPVTQVNAHSGSGTATETREDYSLRGTLTRAGERVLVQCDLVSTSDQSIVWSTERSANGTEIQLLAAAISYEVAQHLNLSFPDLYQYVTDIDRASELATTADAKLTVEALHMGRFQDAMEPATRLVEIYPKALGPAVWRAHALLLAWDAEPTPKAREQLRGGLAYLRRIDAKSPYVAFYEAYIESHSNPAKAVDLFSAILSRHDLTPGARSWILRYRALARRSADDVEGSMEDLSASLALDPTNAFTLLIVSGLHEQSGQVEEALLRARQALALLPDFWRGYHTLGVALSAANRWEEAATAFGKACDSVSTQGPCSLHAVTLQKAGKTAKAEVAATLAEKLPPSAPGLYNLACFWALSGNPDKAMEMLKRAIDVGFAEPILDKDNDLASLHKREDFQTLFQKIKAGH